MNKPVRATARSWGASVAFHAIVDANPVFDAPRDEKGNRAPFVEVSASHVGGVWVSVEGADTFMDPHAPTVRVNALVSREDARRIAAALILATLND